MDLEDLRRRKAELEAIARRRDPAGADPAW
jgi:hypothetical protein